MLDHFEWDETEAAANYAKHGVDFASATRVFRDVYAIEIYDNRYDYGEDRYVLIGMVDGLILAVVYTEREDCIRLISARPATQQEQYEYLKQIT